MTTTEVPASPASAPKPNGFQRVIGVLMAPNETFASIARQPDWVVPLVIILVVALIGGILFAQRVDFATPMREAMEQRGNMQPDQIDRAIRMTTAFTKVLSYTAPVTSAIVLLIVAAINLLAFRLFGGEGDFRQAFSVTLYAWMPNVIKSIIVTAIIASRTVQATDLPTLLRSNLAFLVTMKVHPMLFSLLSGFDVFSFWLLALLIIGFAYVAKFSKSKSAAIVISLWVVIRLVALIGPAIQTLRRQ